MLFKLLIVKLEQSILNDSNDCKYLTIQWNTDIIQVFNSSKMSV